MSRSWFACATEAVLAAQLDHLRPLYCRMCGSCTGVCGKGMQVADTLRFLTYAEGYGQFAWPGKRGSIFRTAFAGSGAAIASRVRSAAGTEWTCRRG